MLKLAKLTSRRSLEFSEKLTAQKGLLMNKNECIIMNTEYSYGAETPACHLIWGLMQELGVSTMLG